MPVLVGGTISDYQFKIGATILGPGTPYIIQRTSQGGGSSSSSTGFSGFGIPDIRSGDLPRPLDHGDFFGRDFLASRSVVIPITVVNTSPAAVVASVQSLLLDWHLETPDSTTTSPLSFKFPGLEVQRLNGRPRRALFDMSTIVTNTVIGTLEYQSADPAIYSDVPVTYTAALPTLGSGRTYNRVYNLVYGVGSTGGFVNVTNNGTFRTRPVVIISGPCDSPRVENVTAGKFIQLNLSLLAGDSLVIDFDAKTINLNGASRYYTRTNDSSWWDLAPGTSQINFRASAFVVGALMSITTRSAWLGV